MTKTQKNKQMGGKTRKVTNCRYSATMQGLNAWHKAMFEQLGWMVLAKEKYHLSDKISTYKNSINRLKEAIECKLTQVREKDRKDDLKILWDNVMVLKAHVEKDF